MFHIGHFRALDQYRVHIDMDAYFANVEARDDPKLRMVPFAVGSDRMIVSVPDFYSLHFPFSPHQIIWLASLEFAQQCQVSLDISKT